MKKLAEQVRNGEQIPDEDILRYHRGIAALQQRIDFETAPAYRNIETTILWGPPRSGKDSYAINAAELRGEKIYIMPP